MGSRDNLFRSSDKIQGVSRLFKGFSQPGHMSRSCSGNSLNLKVLTRYVIVAQDHFVVVHNRSIGKSPVNHLLNKYSTIVSQNRSHDVRHLEFIGNRYNPPPRPSPHPPPCPMSTSSSSSSSSTTMVRAAMHFG